MINTDTTVVCDWNSHFEQTGKDTDQWLLYPYGNNDGEYRELPSDCKYERCWGRMAKCPNWDYCHSEHPRILMDCWGGRCLYCDPSLGRNLEFKSIVAECPIRFFLSVTRVCFPGCAHEVCVDCPKTMLYGSLYQNLAIRDTINSICKDCESCQYECDIDDDCPKCGNQCDHDPQAIAAELSDRYLCKIKITYLII